MTDFDIHQFNLSVGNLNNSHLSSTERESSERSEISTNKWWIGNPIHDDLLSLFREYAYSASEMPQYIYLLTTMPTTNRDTHQDWLEHKQLEAVRRKLGKVRYYASFRERGEHSLKWHTHTLVVSNTPIDYDGRSLNDKVYFNVKHIPHTDLDLLYSFKYVSKHYTSQYLRYQDFNYSKIPIRSQNTAGGGLQ